MRSANARSWARITHDHYRGHKQREPSGTLRGAAGKQPAIPGRTPEGLPHATQTNEYLTSFNPHAIEVLWTGIGIGRVLRYPKYLDLDRNCSEFLSF